jgi:hypothetical protein
VVAKTGWRLRVPENVPETPAPSEAELAVIRDFDPHHFWTGQSS